MAQWNHIESVVNNGSVNTLLTVGHQVIIWTNTDLLSITPQDQIWVIKLNFFIEQNQIEINVFYEWPPTTMTTLYSVWYTVWWNVSRMQENAIKRCQDDILNMPIIWKATLIIFY